LSFSVSYTSIRLAAKVSGMSATSAAAVVCLAHGDTDVDFVMARLKFAIAQALPMSGGLEVPELAKAR